MFGEHRAIGRVMAYGEHFLDIDRRFNTADSWTARGILDEHAFLNRKHVPIPAGPRLVARVATTLSGLFMGIVIRGLVRGEFWTAFAGWHAPVVCQAWFVDRMALLWVDMKDKHPTCAALGGRRMVATVLGEVRDMSAAPRHGARSCGA